ncbi:MAG TPA: hypothetical protein ENI69_02460 [Rhodospirillales bacterium]|mgnify:CR=1 FL=1|nr:hypothetical protein [Rhodospirillales bacterium]
MDIRNRKVARFAVPLLLIAALPGCLPLGAPTMIGLALDGFSLMASGKTVADHALSQIARQDCSIGRAVLTGVEVCTGDLDQPVQVADNNEHPAQEAGPENPLYATRHPSRWPLPAELQ